MKWAQVKPCWRLIKKLHSSRFVTAYIPNPHLSPDELKLTLAQEIGVPDCTHIPHFQLLGHISRRLIELAVQKNVGVGAG